MDSFPRNVLPAFESMPSRCEAVDSYKGLEKNECRVKDKASLLGANQGKIDSCGAASAATLHIEASFNRNQ